MSFVLFLILTVAHVTFAKNAALQGGSIELAKGN